MRVAVLTCCWDRLAYTQHCFSRLFELAGCEYDHYVWDNGSTDGTPEWLAAEENAGRLHATYRVPGASENIGIWRGFNSLIAAARGHADYDVFVTFDNDCEVLTPNTLRDVCTLALDHDLLLSPRILGLRSPPPAIATIDDGIELTYAIGNVFMAIPAWVIEERFPDQVIAFDESKPFWGGDEIPLAEWARAHGSGVGYATGYEANHYRTTDGQHAELPWYFERKRAEGCPV